MNGEKIMDELHLEMIDRNKDRLLQQNKVKHFMQWIQKSPVSYSAIHETSDEDIITINFHGKNIYNRFFNE